MQAYLLTRDTQGKLHIDPGKGFFRVIVILGKKPPITICRVAIGSYRTATGVGRMITFTWS